MHEHFWGQAPPGLATSGKRAISRLHSKMIGDTLEQVPALHFHYFKTNSGKIFQWCEEFLSFLRNVSGFILSNNLSDACWTLDIHLKISRSGCVCDCKCLNHLLWTFCMMFWKCLGKFFSKGAGALMIFLTWNWKNTNSLGWEGKVPYNYKTQTKMTT